MAGVTLTLVTIACCGADVTTSDRSLATLTGIDYQDSNAVVRQSSQMSAEISEAIQICMLEAGFEYYQEPITIRSPFPEETPPGSLEWIRRYGLGVSTATFAEWQVGSELAGFPAPLPDFAADSSAQQTYLDGLSGGERSAYNEALNGEPPDSPLSSSDAIEEHIRTGDGCWAESTRSVTNNNSFYQLFTNLGDEVPSINAAVAADPRMISYENEIGTCLRTSGFAWENLDQARTDFSSQARELTPIPLEQILLDAGLAQDATTTDFEQLVAAQPHFDTEDVTSLRQIQRDRRDRNCTRAPAVR